MPELKKICSLLLLLAFLISCTKKDKISSEQRNYFVKYFGGSATDQATDMLLNTDGSFVFTGSLTGEAKVSQAFFIHADPYGNLLDSSPFVLSSGNLSKGNCIYKTSDGGYLIAGFITSAGHQDKDVYVVRLSSTGSVLWAKPFGGTSDDEALSVKEVSSGYILVGGYTESYGNGGKDAWGILLDSNGNKLWDRTYGFAGDDIGINFIEEGSYYLLVGYTVGSSVFLAKVDKVSGIPFDFGYYGTATDISAVKSINDGAGNMYVLANSATSSSLSNIYILKLNDSAHQVIWEKYLTSSIDQKANDIVLQNSQIVIGGSSTANQNSDFLIDILDSDGNLLNAGLNTLPASGNQAIQACTIDTDGKIVFAGNDDVQGFSKICLVKTDLPR